MARTFSNDLTTSWSELYAFRRQAAARFGKQVFSLPLVKRVRDVLCDSIGDNAAVLEVGAGDRRWCATLSELRTELRYESMDIDARGRHDYTDLADIRR